MKIVVIGGTGLIGSKTVAILRQGGHEVVAASPQSGVNTITGEGLKEAVAGAQVVVDLANSPSFEDKAVMEFFETSGIPYTVIRRDPVHGIPPRHRRFEFGRKQGQASARLIPAHRGGRCCSYRRRSGARGAAKRHR